MKDRITKNDNEWPDAEFDFNTLSFAISMIMIVILIIIAMI